jgi:hypothetical protein
MVDRSEVREGRPGFVVAGRATARRSVRSGWLTRGGLSIEGKGDGVRELIAERMKKYQLTLARRMELESAPIAGPFDLVRWTQTHRRLFQDVYAWAGRIRTAGSRGAMSLPVNT